MTTHKLEDKIDQLEEKMEHRFELIDCKFERMFKELMHLRGKLYAGAGAISVVVTLVLTRMKGVW